MDQVEIFLVFTERLEQSGINYMTTGSVASMMYGMPRFTHDLDVVIDLSTNQIDDIIAVFPADDFYCPPKDVIQIESRRPLRGHFNIIHHTTGFKADVYIHNRSELHGWGLSRKKLFELPNAKGIWVAPPEYVIVRKLEYYREGHSEKHLLDIVGMLEVSGEFIDRDVIKEWVTKLGLERQWQEVVSRCAP
ncbi:MAG: hypothetical protein PHO37_09280 [Kiritimatiellae bacterium]|nr:hypothetical protein [Kiritimatiellia bacterium]